MGPQYPEKALRADIERVRRIMETIRKHPTTPDTRLADNLQNYNPAATDDLLNLMLGGYFASSGRIWTLHSRRCFYDPAKRRAGVPEDVAALAEKLAADSATLVLVNVNPVEPHTAIVQAGGYREHRFEAVTVGAETKPLGGPLLKVRLGPGCGARLAFRMTRYQNRPTLAHPWHRGLW